MTEITRALTPQNPLVWFGLVLDRWSKSLKFLRSNENDQNAIKS